MPKTAVNEDNGSVAGQNHIRLAWKLLPVQPKAVAESMQQRTDDDFRGGIASLDTAHHTAAFLRGEDIGHPSVRLADLVCIARHMGMAALGQPEETLGLDHQHLAEAGLNLALADHLGEASQGGGATGDP